LVIGPDILPIVSVKIFEIGLVIVLGCHILGESRDCGGGKQENQSTDGFQGGLLTDFRIPGVSWSWPEYSGEEEN
jgi:hypothetical protein